MKKLVCLLLVALLMVGVAGCGKGEAGNSDQSSVRTDAQSLIDSGDLYAGVYIVGEDIAEDSFFLTCEETDYTMRVVIFETVDDYQNYKNSDLSTIEKRVLAIETNSVSCFGLDDGNQIYIGLQSSNVLLIEDGKAKITPIGNDDNWYLVEGSVVPSGLYFENRDITVGRYSFTCVDTDWDATVAVFDSYERYLSYMKELGTTSKDETIALQKYAFNVQELDKNETCSVIIKTGSVLLIEDGKFVVKSE